MRALLKWNIWNYTGKARYRSLFAIAHLPAGAGEHLTANAVGHGVGFGIAYNIQGAGSAAARVQRL